MALVAILVDVQNIYYTTRDAYGRAFNYRRFWQYMINQHEVVIANAYAIASANDGQHKFQQALKHIGFEVKLKPYIQRQDGSAKGDWDVGITIDAIEASAKVDKVILLSGDGDFDCLMHHLRDNKGITTQVFSVATLTAASLIASVDEYQPIGPDLLL
ncbi:NYN domain-containing protein [Thalassotalea aquiviva]|uniref:LabA-like NYN domain-containing protein n=1 Tax=Thalassotalea aquiviva TaxID=3242415 RepID=UPI00352A7951